MTVYICKTHRGLISYPCWHGKCPVCGKGVTAFDFTRGDAEEIVAEHVQKEHA